MNTHTLEETVLVALGKSGDQDAISELFRRHYPRCLGVARGILRGHEDAQDAVQAALLLAFRQLGGFREEASFKTWVTRIVVNCCLLQMREKRNRVTCVQLGDRNGARGPDVLASQNPTPEASAWRKEIEMAFATAVARLPEHLQEPYRLFTMSELSLQEVAASLGLTLSGTKTRLYRARAGIRTSLQPVWSGRLRV